MALTDEKRKKFNRNFWKLFILGSTIVIAIFTLITIGWIGYIPNLEQLQNPINKSATEIYSSDMKLLGKFYQGTDNRIPINYNDISPNIINALIATEDARYLKHSGIDVRSLARAIVGVATGQKAGGGSTITQQLAKQLYSPRAKNKITRIFQKPIEWVIAIKIERLYSKEEIITMYLNQFDFLYNAVGIKSAAKTYFGTTANKLKIEQAATLIGMCKNPTYFNPLRHNERSKQRRNTVLQQMEKYGYITQQTLDSLTKTPLTLHFKRDDHKEGLATYFRQYLRKTLTAHKPKNKNYTSWQQQQLQDDKWAWENNPLYGFFEKNKKADGTTYNLYTDGLKIYTTIDSRMQKYAEDAVNEHMIYLQKAFFREKKGRKYAPFAKRLTQEEREKILKNAIKQTERYRKLKKYGANQQQIKQSFQTKTEMEVFSYKGWIDTIMTPLDSIKYHKHFLRCGLMSIDPRNGHVKAYVGGTNYKAFQYDMVTQGRRQVGSVIKPYLYTLAMEEGLSPCDKVMNESITIGNWTPKNASNNRVGELVSLRWGLANSNNWISARLMNQFTPDALVSLMRSFGIKGYLDPVVSIALGSAEISVAEMTEAYTAYPSKGIRTEAIYVTRIEDANGNILADFTPKVHEIFSESTAYKMLNMLQAVINEGTGRRVRFRYGLQMPAGGKTGTSQHNADGWFMGFTPKLVSGVWVGGEEPSIHFDYTTDGQGASMALPIWSIYMKKVLNDPKLEYRTSDQFNIPEEYQYNSCE